MSPFRLLCALLQLHLLTSATAAHEDGDLNSDQSVEPEGNNLCTLTEMQNVASCGYVSCDIDMRKYSSCNAGLSQFSLGFNSNELQLLQETPIIDWYFRLWACTWIRSCPGEEMNNAVGGIESPMEGQLPFKQVMDQDVSVHESNVDLLALPAASDVEAMIWRMLPWLCFGLVLFSVVFSLCYCRKVEESSAYQKIDDDETNVLLPARESV